MGNTNVKTCGKANSKSTVDKDSNETVEKRMLLSSCENQSKTSFQQQDNELTETTNMLNTLTEQTKIAI